MVWPRSTFHIILHEENDDETQNFGNHRFVSFVGNESRFGAT